MDILDDQKTSDYNLRKQTFFRARSSNQSSEDKFRNCMSDLIKKSG